MFDFSFFALLAFFAAAGVIDYPGYALSAVLIHELGHLLVLVGRRVQIEAIEFSCTGVEIRRSNTYLLSYRGDLCVYFAGPGMNLLAAAVLSFAQADPLLVIFHLTLGGFNLLPISALDGGRILSTLLSMHHENSQRITESVSLLLLIPLLGIAVLFAVGAFGSPGNCSLLIVSLYLLLTVFA